MSFTKLIDHFDDNIAIHIASNEQFPGDVALTFKVPGEINNLSLVISAGEVSSFCQSILDAHMKYLPKSEEEIQ